MRKPDWIEFTLTIGCSLNCDYCPQPLLARRYRAISHDAYPVGAGFASEEKIMSVKTFFQILDHVPIHVGVDFSGYADPCLHPKFIDLIEHAVMRGYATSLYTTFEGLSLEHYDRLRVLPLETVSVHLPDVAEMVHVKWTEDYRKIMDALLSNPPRCQFLDLMTVKGPLHPDLFFLEPPPVRVQYIQPRSGNVRDDLSTHEQPKTGPVQCARGANLRQNVVLPDGNVYLCCCDYGLTAKLGNLKDKTYDELDAERQKILERQKKPDEGLLCSTCEFAVPVI